MKEGANRTGPTPRKHSSGKETVFNYIFFEGVGPFNDFVDNEAMLLNRNNQQVLDGVMDGTERRIAKGSEWYGTPVPSSLRDLEEHRFFAGMDLLKQVQPKVRKQLAAYMDYLEEEILPKPKLAYNSKGLGVFSFERAAMGLHRQVDVDLRTPMKKTVSQLKVALGHSRPRTSVKEVFAFFKDKESPLPALRLFILAGANAWVSGDEMLYVALACSELVDFLESRGVAVEVNVILASEFDGQVCAGCIAVKRFQDPLDKNQLLLMTGDARYFRYRGFKGLISISNYLGKRIPDSLGSMTESLGRGFVEVAGLDGFTFEQSYSLQDAAAEVKKIVMDYKEKLKNERRN